MRFVLIFAALVFLASNNLFAQNIDTLTLRMADTSILDEVVVTGSKIETEKKKVPFSVSQISSQQIENTGQMNVLPVLNHYVPGVFVTERNILGFGVATGGSGGINIRGIGGAPNTGVLVLIDGQPQFQGIFGHPLADAYVASDIEKVEVIRGPVSMLYGTNAMGGVVNLISKQNITNDLNGSIGVSYGSFNTQKYYGTINYKDKKLQFFTSFNHDRTDGIRKNTDFNITNGYQSIGIALNNHFNVVADMSLAGVKANDNGPVLKPAPFNINILRGKTSVSLFNRFAKSAGALRFYHNFGQHNFSDGFYSTDRNSGIQFYQTLKLFEGNLFTAGTDLRQYGGKANMGKAKDSLKTVNEIAGYIYMQQTLAKIFTINAGLRAEHSNIWGTQLVPVGGISVSPTSFTTFKTSVSKGFRSPSIMELYLYAANPDLKPEKMLNYELSWLQNLLTNKLKIEITGYIINGKNQIQVVGIPPNIKRENVGNFNNKGIEISANYMPFKGLHLHTNYSYLHQQTVTLAAPKHQFNLNGNYRYKILNFFTGIQYIDKLYSNINPKAIQYYTLWNARMSVMPVRKLSIFVAANNLLNQEYEINYGYPMPDRNYAAGIDIKF